MFLAYIVYRPQFPAAFASGSHHLDITFGAINTASLIGSISTMVLAVHAAQTSNRAALVRWLIWTIFLGLAFLGIKGFEYSHKLKKHLIPGAAFQYEEEFAQHAQNFFIFYFAMTGLHAFYMIIGIVLFFMYVRQNSQLTKLFVGASFFWLVIMFRFTLRDIFTREGLSVPHGWQHGEAVVTISSSSSGSHP